MAIGTVAYPGFTDAHEISNREHFHSNVRAVNVIASKGTNTIDLNESLIPNIIHKNANNQEVRWVYTGKTAHYFLVQTTNKPFGISIEHTGGDAITSLKVFESVTGLNWGGFLNGANILAANITANTAYILRTLGEQYPPGMFLLLEITCGTNTNVSMQVVSG